jgi:hypothetical protein
MLRARGCGQNPSAVDPETTEVNPFIVPGSLQLSLLSFKRRPAGGRKRPSSAAENQAVGTRINTPGACIDLALRAPRLETCAKTRTGRSRWRIGIAHGPSAVRGAKSSHDSSSSSRIG